MMPRLTYERKAPSRVDEPEPGDEQVGVWSKERLLEMDTAFGAAMARALAKKEAITRAARPGFRARGYTGDWDKLSRNRESAMRGA